MKTSNFLFVIVMLCLAALAPAEEMIKWQHVNEEPAFGERYDHAAVVFQDKMWVIGGNSSTSWHNDVWNSTDGVTWTQVQADAPWKARGSHQVLAFNDRLWLMGGYGFEMHNDVWSSADGVTWEQATEAAPWVARSYFRAEVFNDRMLVFGGHEAWKRLNDVWASTDGVNWELLTESAGWSPRSDFASAVHNGRLYVFGGTFFDYESWLYNGVYGHFVYLKDIWSTADGVTWELEAKETLMGGRALANMSSLGEYLVVVGGDESPIGEKLARHSWFSRNGRDWHMLHSSNRKEERNERRGFTSQVVFDGTIWSIAGLYYPYAEYVPLPHVLRLDADVTNLEKYIDGNPPKPMLQPGDPGFKIRQ